MGYILRIAVLVLLLVLAVPAVSYAVEVVAAEPAVEAPPEAGDEEEEPWTARFLAPTVLALGVVALGGSLLYYGIRVRGRYRIQQ